MAAKPASGTRIEEVELIRYPGPPVGRRSLARSSGLVVRLRGGAGAAALIGIGEVVVGPPQVAVAWEQGAAVVSGLVGALLPDRVEPPRPLAAIEGWRPVRLSEREPARAAKLAVEMALLDLLAKHTCSPAPTLWGGTAVRPTPVAPQPLLRLPQVSPGESGERLTSALHQDPGEAWALRLRLTGMPDRDLAWVRHLAGLERSAGRDRPIWVVGGALAPHVAEDLVRRLTELMVAGDLPSMVLVEEPVPVADRAWLPRLQQMADDILGTRAAGTAADRQLLVFASHSVSSRTGLRDLCEQGPVGGLRLSPARFGSMVNLRRAAKLAKQVDPAMLVVLNGVQGSGLTTTALAMLATTVPEIDRYIPEPDATGWPWLLVGNQPDDDAPASGLFAGLDVSALAAIATERLVVPSWASARSGKPNEFPGYPLPVAQSELRSSQLLVAESLRAGLRVWRGSSNFILVEPPITSGSVRPPGFGFYGAESSLTSVAAAEITRRKEATREVLAGHGLPVPQGSWFAADDYEAAYQAGLAMGFPLVVKPAAGRKGYAVTTGITSAEELAQALDRVAASRYRETGVVVERFVTGSDYRVLATPDEVISVVRREPASVVGDGLHTIEEQVLAVNTVRRSNPNLGELPIRLGVHAESLLRRQGLTLRSVPAAGRQVLLSDVANLSQGGTSHEVRDSAHPSLLAIATAVISAFPGLPHAGLDIILEDHRRPVDAQTVAILELNSNPMLAMHHFPMYGPPRDAAGQLVTRAAAAAGLPLARGTDDVAVRVTVRGRVQTPEYQHWLAHVGDQLALDLAMTDTDEPDQLSMVVAGPAVRVAVLLALALRGPSPRWAARIWEIYAEPDASAGTAGSATTDHRATACGKVG